MTPSQIKHKLTIGLGISCMTVALAASEAELSELLTPEEAETIVKQRRADREAVELERRQAALGEAALEERHLTREDGQKIVFRRIAPAEKVELDAAPVDENAPSLQELFSEAEEGVILFENIHLGANVYGDQYSEIQWRDPEANLNITIWSNINLHYLRPVSSFTIDDVEYGYFGFITYYSEETEEQRAAFAEAHGFPFESRWKTPPVVFSEEYYEYYVDAPWDLEVPEKLYRQLDALFSFYLSNYERLEIEHKNAQMLHAARKQDLEDNPPVKPDRIIMNYTLLRGADAE